MQGLAPFGPHLGKNWLPFSDAYMITLASMYVNIGGLGLCRPRVCKYWYRVSGAFRHAAIGYLSQRLC
jgi:hypothetical protein